MDIGNLFKATIQNVITPILNLGFYFNGVFISFKGLIIFSVVCVGLAFFIRIFISSGSED